ncbi:hypothetical protein B0H66DRAFT_602712 [Apodospora peruviana]|uniref:Heterokaryon incompatibility domain-containing protein n=1 Tax=Apodospora peruviana TaxID=516989 RepID=A0AAE0M507_9PEZI|nr:hypothetical protein B0H66DRAFT_602712 [Apodospora peruviana]
MRLLDTKTLRLQEFVVDIPPYAILSHTWGAEEVTYHDLAQVARDPTSADSHAIRRRNGFDKMVRFCAQAQREYHDWAWVDICCIDKTSSAELSEAINSMYDWYRGAPGAAMSISRMWTLSR